MAIPTAEDANSPSQNYALMELGIQAAKDKALSNTTVSDNTVINRYSGKVQSNLLDLYDIPTYNLKLYATGFEALETLKANDSIDDLDGESMAREDKGDTAKGTSTNNFQLSPADVIILAQTGVTAGVGIDNLEITNVPGKKSNETQCNFKITQPGAADFIDQLYWTAYKLGIDVASKMPLVLEIDFQGYQESSTSDTFDGEGGQIKHIAGPYRYVLELTNFDITIGPEGSEYNFTTVVQDDTAFADKFFTLKAAHSTSGATIQDHLTDLAVKMNKRLAGDDEDESGTVDTITWDLSEFVSEEAEGSTIVDPALRATADAINSNPKSDKHPKITNQSVLNDTLLSAYNSKSITQIEAETQTEASAESSSTEGEEKTVPISVTLSHEEDDNLFACLGRILSLNSDFMSHATRTKFAEGDKGIGEWDPGQTHVWWYTIKSKVTIGEFDNKKKTYSKNVTYKPLIVNTPSTSTGVTADELTATDTATLNNFDIQKAYEYTYTGRNDQILNLNIAHQFGVALLVPKNKGMGGSSASNLYAVQQADPLAAEDVTNIGDLFDLFKKGKKIFDTLKNFDSDTLKDMAANAGFSSDKIKDLISDTAGQAAQDLANALAGAVTGDDEIKRLIKDQVFGSANSPTESDDERQKQIDQYYALGEYKAQPSGYEYSADFNFKIKETTAEEDADNETQNQSDTAEIDTTSKAGQGPANTYAGAQTSMFNFLYNQNEEPSIMKQLDFEIRGDPYYLGDSESSLGDFRFDTDGDNFFLFMLNNPRRFDMDIDEEDNNTGEWNKFNTSWTMSGIYRLVSAQNNFNNGVFTTSIVAVKETGVDLSKVSPEDLANYNITLNQNAGDLADKGLGGADESGIDPMAFTDPVGYINGQISGGGFGGLTDSEIVNKLQADGKINSSQAQAWRDAQ